MRQLVGIPPLPILPLLIRFFALVDAYNYAANNPLKNPRYNEKPFSRPLTYLLNAPPLPTDITHGDMVFITKVLSGHTSVRVTMERTEVFNTRHLWYTDHRDVIWKPLRLWPIEDIHEALNYARSLRIFAHILDDDDFDMYFALARRLGKIYYFIPLLYFTNLCPCFRRPLP